MDPLLLQQVRSTPLFAGLADEETGCLAPGELIESPAGAVLASEGERNGFFHVVLGGELRITRTYDRQSILMAVTKPGNYTGETMLLLGIPWVATCRVTKPARLFRFDEDGFWRMVTCNPGIAREIFRSAANRMRNLEGYSQQREKLVSLGTMAAGLAHELNNPAAAARRAAAHLQQTTDKIQSFLCLLAKVLEPVHWRHLLDASDEASGRLAGSPASGLLDRSDRAETIAAWLEGRGVASAWDLAPTFVDAGLDPAWLEDLAARLPAASHAGALGWLAARLDLKSLLRQVEQSSGRITELVQAVKSYSHMGQSPMQLVDIHEGLESTLTMLGHKLRNVTLVRAYDRSVPAIMAYGSELNQVWTNLLDNAIDAVGRDGKICVGTSLENNQIVVEIVDNGSGIPLEAQSHLFEPFFTTKSVGAGTGLGLVISNRIVGDRHGGEIEFESRPGETRFKVRLPVRHEQPSEPPSQN